MLRPSHKAPITTRAGNARVSVSQLVAEDDLVGRVEGDGSNLLQDLAVRPETISKDQRVRSLIIIEESETERTRTGLS